MTPGSASSSWPRQNGIKVYNEDFDKAPIATKDWSSYISKIKASGADGIYIALITNVIPVFAKQAYDFGLQNKAKIVSAAAPGPLELEAGGEACYGIFGASDWSWDVNTPVSDAWEMRILGKIQDHSLRCGRSQLRGGHEPVQRHRKGRQHGSQNIADALRGISFDGPYGTVRISAKDNCMRNDAVLTETMAAPENPFGAKIYMKVLETFSAEELGPPE